MNEGCAVAWPMIDAAQYSKWAVSRGCMRDRKETKFSWYIDSETTYSRRVICPSPDGRKCVSDEFEVHDFLRKLVGFQLLAPLH